MAEATDPRQAADAAFEALRDLGAPGRDPVRWHHLQALARRGAAVTGPAGALLAGRVADEQARWLADLQRSTCDAPEPARPATRPLRALVERLARDDATGAPAGGARELKALQQYRQDWSRLRIEHQLTRSQAQVPRNAGPLNGPGLIHRVLDQAMGLSPAYLQHVLAEVETLMWIEQAIGLGDVPVAARREPRRDGRRPRRPTP